jgi:hypothetical protein
MQENIFEQMTCTLMGAILSRIYEIYIHIPKVASSKPVSIAFERSATSRSNRR